MSELKIGRTGRRIAWLAAAVAAVAFSLGCSETDDSGGAEEDLGPIETVLDEVTQTVWPGNTLPDGSRHIRRLNGFFDGGATSYWFVGFAPRITADVFWFCRESDTACPVDDKGVIAWDHVVGQPVFARVPGEDGFSPFWLIWVVTVPDDYEPNEIKSVLGIERAAREGRVGVRRLIFDHGGAVGPDESLMHCLLVLDGTTLQDNGADIVGKPGEPSMVVPVAKGWHKQYQVNFFDFTNSEGVFAPDTATESRPLMPSSDIFVMFRDCEGGSEVEQCKHVGEGELAAVSERGVEDDMTGDGDKADTNNVIVAFPGVEPTNPNDPKYSPLWRVNVVRIEPEHDEDITLIDDTSEQNGTEVTSIATIREKVGEGLFAEPENMSESMAGNRIPGNDGRVFFNCPSQVPAKR